MDKKLVLRSLFPHIQAHLADKEITVLIGPRQVGKTTLITSLKDDLIARGVLSSDVYYFNLDVVTDKVLFQNQSDLIQFIKNRISGRNKLYLFVDEVQRIENAGLFFKGVYDLHLPVKLVLTGSSSLEIRSKTSESLTGRKRLFTLYPLNFFEYLSSHDDELVPFIGKKDAYASAKILTHFETFNIFGGYPKVALETIREKKILLLEEIFSSYVEKDVVGFLRVRDTFAFSQLVRIIASEIGNLFNTERVARELGVKSQTIRHYLDILGETFILQRVNPFFYSPATEIRKMPKLYFFDAGIRNFAKDNRDFSVDSLKQRADRGGLLENFVLSELIKLGINDIRFWRTKDDAEVDFVIQKKGATIPIEVKSDRGERPHVSRSFRSFIHTYKPKIGIVIAMGHRKRVKIKDTDVYFLFPYELPDFLGEIIELCKSSHSLTKNTQSHPSSGSG